MIPRLVFIVLSLAVAASGGCARQTAPATAGSPPPGPPWMAALGADHPLAGRIWRPADGRFIEAGALIEHLSDTRFVLLGEKHDNADHHRIQAWVLARLIAHARRPAVAFEMFRNDQDQALADYLAAHPKDAAGLGPALAWDQSGWPAWRHYRPIAQAALDGGAPILAADLARGTIRDISRRGAAALGAERVESLGLDQPMPAALNAVMREEIVESHCRQLPETMIDPMVTVMRARDAHMAAVLVRGGAMDGRDGAVLIAGKGHVRADHGVPFHLARLARDDSVASVGLVEVVDTAVDPASYAGKFASRRLPFDFVWFTPRVDRKDPCEEFAEQLRRARDRHIKERAPD